MNDNAFSDKLLCFSSIQQLLTSYNGYAPLFDSSSPHYVAGVRSQLKPAAWREMLSGGPNQIFGQGEWDSDSLYLLDGVMHGFKIIDPGADITPYFTANYMSAEVTSRENINDIILSEISDGKLSVVDSAPTCIHALGAVPKPNGKCRPITDASRPRNISINNFMQQTFSHFKFKRIDDVCADLQRNQYLAVTDLAAAYRSTMIRAYDRQFQGLKWDIDGSPWVITA